MTMGAYPNIFEEGEDMSNEKREEAKSLLSKTPYPLFPAKQFPITATNKDIALFAKQIRKDIILSTYAA